MMPAMNDPRMTQPKTTINFHAMYDSSGLSLFCFPVAVLVKQSLQILDFLRIQFLSCRKLASIGFKAPHKVFHEGFGFGLQILLLADDRIK